MLRRGRWGSDLGPGPRSRCHQMKPHPGPAPLTNPQTRFSSGRLLGPRRLLDMGSSARTAPPSDGSRALSSLAAAQRVSGSFSSPLHLSERLDIHVALFAILAKITFFGVTVTKIASAPGPERPPDGPLAEEAAWAPGRSSHAGATPPGQVSPWPVPPFTQQLRAWLTPVCPLLGTQDSQRQRAAGRGPGSVLGAGDR